MTSKSEHAPRPGGASSRSKSEPLNLTESSDPLNRVLEQLRKGGSKPRSSGSQWTAKCPAHDDHNPSLGVSRGDDGRALVHCHAGCKPEEVCRALGLSLRDLMPPTQATPNVRPDHSAAAKPAPKARRSPRRFTSPEDLKAHLGRSQKRPCTKEWIYHQHDGSEAFRVVRFEADGRKSYRPIHRTPDGWMAGDPPGLLPLYNLPKLRDAEEVLVLEGEKCADVATELGFVATTSAHGAKAASGTDWSPLAGKRVIILPDADDAGDRYAIDVAEQLRGLTRPAQVRVLQLTELLPGEDLADWAARRPDLPRPAVAEQLRDLLSSAVAAPLSVSARRRFVTRRASEIKPAAIKWLLEGLIPLGKLTLLCGDPGLGKSLLTVELAARVSRGEPLFPGGACCPFGHTLIISAEDDPADTLRPRLELAGADLERVSILDGVKRGSEDAPHGMWDLSQTEVLAQWVRDHPDLRLVIVDPVSAYLAGADAHRDAEVRAVMQQLITLAAEHGFAVVCVSHLNKRTSASAIYRALGSIAFVAAARSVLVVAADPLEDDRRVLVQTKRNLSAAASSRAFRVTDGPRLCFEPEPVEVDVDSLLNSVGPGDSSRGARKEAAEWLETQLANGPVLVSELRLAAGREGFPERTLRRARDSVGAISVQTGFGNQSTVWQFPDNAK